jgi:hypothetical protein
MSTILKFYNNNNPNVLKLGVLYSPSSIPSKPDVTNYIINEYFLKIVDTMLQQLSINDILLVSIPINLPYSIAAVDETTKKAIYATLSKYTDITYFICSFGSEQLEILQEIYFKFNKKITLLSTSSSKTLLKFNDNIIRFLPSDYTLVNFISNYFFHDTVYCYDCVFIGGSFYELEGKPVFGNLQEISETIAFINDYLILTGRNLLSNSLITNNDDNLDIDNLIESIRNELDSNLNPNYYHSNLYSNYIIQYIQNSPSDFSSIQEHSIFNQWLNDYPAAQVTNWKVFQSYMLPDMTVDNSKPAIIYHFMLYLTFFDYSQKKKIILFMSNFQFPAFLSIITYLIPQFGEIFGKTELLSKFIKNSQIIFTNTQNRDEFTSELFNDIRTDTLWYNNGKTWMDLLNLYNPMIFLPRYDQSINLFINKLSLELNMYSSNNKYIDISTTSPIFLITVYNALQFVYHFYKNGLNMNNFVLNYFLKSTLLYFGNNLVFDENMDNVFNIIIGTGYFNNANAIINRSSRSENKEIKIDLKEKKEEGEETNMKLYENSSNWSLFWEQLHSLKNKTQEKKIEELLTSRNNITTINNTFILIVKIGISQNTDRIKKMLEWVKGEKTDPFASRLYSSRSA